MKTISKTQLQTGDVVMRKNGLIQIFISKFDSFIGNTGYTTGEHLNDDLTAIGKDEWDIVKVLRPSNAKECYFNAFKFDYGEIIHDTVEKDKTKGKS